ncbi:pyrimidine dimer DNA glycosylase/endonuclease V [Glutamicibacter uratoxydans]|uniref:pyrimidine dimer DNA glycosylase/endonuclease V n=1 Tax=Glutamicibacter uratoxydans TaxID=43667 RepID=UPI003D6E6523
MRLWTLHPSLLDTKGLVACWRETLLAQKVLAEHTTGYRNHPQLERLRATANPLETVGFYLKGLWEEADARGYHFRVERILEAGNENLAGTLPVTVGQVLFEAQHLERKLLVRDPSRVAALPKDASNTRLHALFRLVDGPVEPWEKDPLAHT